MKVKESIDEYFARTLNIANKIMNHDEKMTNVMVIDSKIQLCCVFNWGV